MYKICANTFTTEAGEDIIATIKTALSEDRLVARKLHVVHSSAATLDINGWAEVPLYLDTDGNYRLVLNTNEVQISSLKTKDAETGIYVLILY